MSDQCGVVVIKDDLKFAGQRVKIVSRSKLQIDCEFEGDVTGPEVVISEQGKVKGIVAGERVTVFWWHTWQRCGPEVLCACGRRHSPLVACHREGRRGHRVL